MRWWSIVISRRQIFVAAVDGNGQEVAQTRSGGDVDKAKRSYTSTDLQRIQGLDFDKGVDLLR